MPLATRSTLRRLALLACLAPALAHADDGTHVGAAVTAGLSGFGLDVGVNLTDFLGLRGTFATYSLSHNGNYSTSVTWSAQARLRQAGLLVDLYPFGSGIFRLSAGAIDDLNQVTGTAQTTASGTLTFNGVSYPASSLAYANANVEWNKVVPYVGVGSGNLAGSRGFHFTTDLGVLISGSPSSALNVACAAGQVCNQLAQNVAVENAKLQNDVHKLNLWPVLRLGFGYAW
jgi:hypothetical protein